MINWQDIVNETLKRRKEEGLTQREHAALANVSIPTMAAFEAGELSLSLAKAFDILKVVGLIDERPPESMQDVFVRESMEKWNAATTDLLQTSVTPFLNGWYRFDYYLEGNPNHGRCTEYVIANPLLSFAFSKQAAEYKRLTPKDQLFLITDYQEDNAEFFPAKSIFDISLPIWHIARTLLHAEYLASYNSYRKSDSPINVHFRALYTGLSGRKAYAWKNPFIKMMMPERVSISDEALLETVVPAHLISENLSEYLYPLITKLYSKFGLDQYQETIKTIIDKEIENIKKYREIE